VNFSEGEDLTASRGGPGVFGWDIPRVQAIVAERKRRGGVVIAIGHCGLEYVPFPPPYVVAAFRAVVDAGADAVIGHHPHVPQGVEWHAGRPIVYSLGNFVFYQPVDLHHRKTGFFVTLELQGDTVAHVDLHPYRITDAGLRSLDAREADDFTRGLQAISRPFESAGGPERAWEAYLASYGREGFVNEARGILDRMDAEPRKAAAMFRNRLTTLQHAELWRDTLTRIVEGGPRRYAAHARRAVDEYFTRTIDPAGGGSMPAFADHGTGRP
jgi:poly-gamma-glutamate synthesis protein (capsule biosynthesis protein)